jgi:hypothetical protein
LRPVAMPNLADMTCMKMAMRLLQRMTHSRL